MLTLADYAIRIEDHYSGAPAATPMDIEWAKDGLDGELYIVQARPETVASQRRPTWCSRSTRSRARGGWLATGRASAPRSPPARRGSSPTPRSQRVPAGEVLVADTTTPDWEPVMKTAAAIVTNRGGRTCHAAIVARELGIPAVVGADDATARARDGPRSPSPAPRAISAGSTRARCPFEVETIDLSDARAARDPDHDQSRQPRAGLPACFLPNDGVGLARLEFIINESIKAHPMALLHPERVEDEGARRDRGDDLAGLPSGRRDFFVERLSEGVGTIAAGVLAEAGDRAALGLQDQRVRGLLGGRAFEPHEENPMLGFRGASRYAHPAYREASRSSARRCAGCARRWG